MKFFFLTFLFAALAPHALAEITLKEQRYIQQIDEKLPKFDWTSSDEIVRDNTRFTNPNKITYADTIRESGLTQSVLKMGAAVQRVTDKVVLQNTDSVVVEHYKLADEKGMIYFFSKDKKNLYRTHLDNIESIKQVTTMHEPPRSYEEINIFREKSAYDKRPQLIPEVSALAGLVNSTFARDLLEDPKARIAAGSQLGAGAYWHFPKFLSLGAVGQWEMVSFRNNGNNSAYYSAWSLGPAVKTKILFEDRFPTRLSVQMRFSYRANLEQAVPGAVKDYGLNVTTLQLNWERPFKNKFGEYFWGLSYQRQWINVQNQDPDILLNSGTGAAHVVGLFVGQGFY